MADRREFTSKTRKQALRREGTRQQNFRDQFEQSGKSDPRSKSSNFKWLESLASGPRTNECITWPFAKRANGYGSIVWRYQRTTAHRVVCELAHGKPSHPSMHAAHDCGNRICCNPAHIRWASPRDNSADKVLHGTQTRGESSPASKLTEQQVRFIRALLANGESLPAIAKRVGCSASNVWFIKVGKSWRHTFHG